MRIAVVGSGIAGLTSAYLLSRAHEVTLFEKDARLGGHTHTHRVDVDGRELSVDTGFIVFNRTNYPGFSRLLAELDVPSRETEMSFSVRNERTGVEYAATSLDALFCQRRNLLSPAFHGMLFDLFRFYRDAKRALADDPGTTTLGEFVRAHGYGKAFVESHIVPMASALWSAPEVDVLALPLGFVARFMDNHRMLELAGRPSWRVVEGGSASYVDALRRRWSVTVREANAVRRVERTGAGVRVTLDDGSADFDHVVLACHSDQALAILDAPSALERELLSAIPYQRNDVVLHTDRRLLPSHRSAWAAWNTRVPRDTGAPCSVSYCMNVLQGFTTSEPVVVTLNDDASVDPSRVLARVTYHHPVFTHEGVRAQARVHAIDGVDRVSYAGAYWGFGFHEDGVTSAIRVARKLGVPWS